MDASPRSTNLSRIYTINVLHADSYKEMSRITSSMDLVVADQDHLVLAQVLRPDRDHVHKVLHRSKSKSLSELVSSYFDNSEKTTRFCLSLRRCIAEARRLYRPIQNLIDQLPQSHCDLVFQEFCKFDKEHNPFPGPDSPTLDQIRDLFGVLNRQLERRLNKSSSRIRFVRPPTVCCSGDAITAYIPSRFARRELAYAAQIKVASRNTYILKTDLDTLDSLVRRLHNAVEGDKRFIQMGLGIMNDNNTAQEVLKHLEMNQQNLRHYLDLLEEKITTCLITVNQSRSLLLQEILHHQSKAESSHSQ
ncbi:UPF0496 protein At3g19330-like [Cucurbita moschata]|uniref:UPF0496 protein At3g19330-like n=1 Tax=Cucurbita moschata TaxID=3662 RepID=A0A6J1ENY5_CUCMO|nr:UPF0496 protein At3g19330-like [Cucurbita moschata]